MATAKSITLTWQHFAIASGLLFAAVIGLSTLFSYFTVRHAAEIRLPFLQDFVRSLNAEESSRSTKFVRDNLNSMAIKLGEMQAQLIRLDTLGERLAGVAGVNVRDIKKSSEKSTAKPMGNNAALLRSYGSATLADGRGGPLVMQSALSSDELRVALDDLSRQVEDKTDALALIESQLLEEQIRKMMLPTGLPVNAQWSASGYGWRLDPFTGERALHEGVDFVAPMGSPINAAAAGIVLSSESHPQYGNMVELDHGRGITTRYAHASKLLVRPGSFVKRGQLIALVGNTGRSTGPHLHFEVRLNGASQNPNRFLQMAQNAPASFAQTSFR
jgi:murein DD-endopeptidase MepM/ murein hydrolase activator NlpD